MEPAEACFNQLCVLIEEIRGHMQQLPGGLGLDRINCLLREMEKIANEHRPK